jgi:hypothetical protein
VIIKILVLHLERKITKYVIDNREMFTLLDVLGAVILHGLLGNIVGWIMTQFDLMILSEEVGKASTPDSILGSAS